MNIYATAPTIIGRIADNVINKRNCDVRLVLNVSFCSVQCCAFPRRLVYLYCNFILDRWGRGAGLHQVMSLCHGVHTVAKAILTGLVLIEECGMAAILPGAMKRGDMQNCV